MDRSNQAVPTGSINLQFYHPQLTIAATSEFDHKQPMSQITANHFLRPDGSIDGRFLNISSRQRGIYVSKKVIYLPEGSSVRFRISTPLNHQIYLRASDLNGKPLAINKNLLIYGNGKPIQQHLFSKRSYGELKLQARQSLYLTQAVLMAKEQQPLPDIFFIVVDSLRADVLGSYGADFQASPYLDKMAGDSILFMKNLVNSSWTRPSTLIFFTGLYASRTHINFWNYPVYPYEKEEFYSSPIYPLAAQLSALGYRSLMIGTNPFLTDHRYLGVDTGFEQIRDFSMVRYDDTVAITEDVIEQLEKLPQKRRPLFYFINYNTPHRPLKPPAKYVRQIKISPPYHPKKKLYLGEVAYVDAEIKRLVEYLQQKKLYKKSILIISSDHGEVMNPAHKKSRFTGVYTLFGHGQGLYEEDIHTPFYLKLPNNKYGGKRIQAMTRSIDIMPTILDAIDSTRSYHKMDGKSMLALLEGEKKPRVYYGESRGVKGIRMDGYKLQKKTYEFHQIEGWQDKEVGPEPHYLFDLQKDPQELTPIDNPKIASNLLKAMKPFEKKQAFYTFRIYNPDKTKEVELQVRSKMGIIKIKSSGKKEVKMSRDRQRMKYKLFVKKQQTIEFSFFIYPDISFPDVQIIVDNRPVKREEFGVGEFDVYPQNCSLQQPECLALYTIQYKKPFPAKDFRIQFWRNGSLKKAHNKKVVLEKDSLEILKKQGYIK